MKVALTSGAYQARSLIASAQRQVNLYSELNPEDSPFPFTLYQTPGLILEAEGDGYDTTRCLYRSSQGELFAVINESVYFVDSDNSKTLLGTISAGTNTCSMADNGSVILLVDGTANGYAIDLYTHSFGAVISDAFYGGDKVDYLDTFFLLNRPGTNQFYCSLSNVTYAMLTGLSGAILAGSITNGGSGYVNGTYTDVPLTGGAGTGVTANIIVVGGIVTSVTLVSEGLDYEVGNSLSANNANLGGSGSGFAYAVDSVGGDAFDPLDIASKIGYPDPIMSLIVVRTEIWLVGELTTEVWFNSGGADFPFQRQSGAFIEHGTIAKYSLAATDQFTFWLSRDKQGKCIVLRGQPYVAVRVSTYAIETELSSYDDVSDAIGWTYQQGGHTFYVLTLPSANKTWVYEVESGIEKPQWHERTWINDDGEENRIRANACAFAYNKTYVGDWQNGNIYSWDLDTYTDNGQPIVRIRSFPHLVDELNRVTYRQFIADMEVGTDAETTPIAPPVVTLRWSDNRGKSYGDGVFQNIGAGGEYLTCVQWQRLGIARDRVFELSWSAATKTALSGAYIDAKPCKT